MPAIEIRIGTSTETPIPTMPKPIRASTIFGDKRPILRPSTPSMPPAVSVGTDPNLRITISPEKRPIVMHALNIIYASTAMNGPASCVCFI
ncbi:hypothetical protein D3C86_1742080 [compost metagenome]